MEILRSKKQACPQCGHSLDSVTALVDVTDPPQEGDVSVCFECTSYLIFDEELTLRVLTSEELLTLPNELMYQLTRARNAIRRLRSGHKSH